MNFGLTRLNNTNISDSDSIAPTQGSNLVKLTTINSSSLSSSDFQNLGESLQNRDLVFNKYGSLLSHTNWINGRGVFFTSPFEPNFPNPSQPRVDSLDVIDSDATSFVSATQYFPSAGNSMPGQTFVSPETSQWILNVSPDSSGQNVYTIYFNPMNNPNLKPSDISANIDTYCGFVNNSDPVCFCSSDLPACLDSAVGSSDNASQLQTLSPTDYNTASANCACLNNQCQYAAANKNAYAKSIIANCNKSISLCGGNFSYKSTGVSSDSDTTISSQCKLTTQQPTPPPPPTPPPSPTKSPKGLSSIEKGGIVLAVVIVIILIMYHFMMQ